MVECSYPSGSTATGFQVIAQLSDSSEVHKLYANTTTDHQTPASVMVEENGMYQVTVFAIRGESGIVDSSVEYMDQITVNGDTTVTTGEGIEICSCTNMFEMPTDKSPSIAIGKLNNQ